MPTTRYPAARASKQPERSQAVAGAGGLARQENRAGAGLVKRLGSVHENGRYVKLEEGRLDTAIVKP